MQYFDSARLFAVIQQDRKNLSPSLKSLLKSDVTALLSSYFDSLAGVKIQVAEERDGYTLMISAKAKRIAPVRALT
ncbi:MAG: hypothetical protein E7363_04310 [Clostridiales bacterium]|nr:hypothetical protein [Clostridiales bacterium]